MSFLLAVIIGLISIILPGFFLAFALLKKTQLHIFEIGVIGFIFGLIFPPTLIWLEAYLIPFSHVFAYSQTLYNADVIILTIIGIVLCIQQGVFKISMPERSKERTAEIKQEERDISAVEREIKHEMQGNSREKEKLMQLRVRLAELKTDSRLVREHEEEEEKLRRHNASELQMVKEPDMKERVLQSHRDAEERMYADHEMKERTLLSREGVKVGTGSANWVWAVLLLLMLITFLTRMQSIGIAPKFFEFDPYYDMISTQYILTYGQQLLYDHAAWPTLTNGTIHRIEPLVPYLEAYWYNIDNGSTQILNTTTLSDVSSYYPALAAALLVFVVFMMIYHDYGKMPALLAAALAAGMPTLISTFIAGEQLLEPWGIFTMFFFVAAYMLAVKNPKEKRYAVLAAIAFISTFLGAHYYTVTAGILTIYIGLQGIVQLLRREEMKDFIYMNAIVIGIIAIFYIIYSPYGGALADRIPTLVGIPVIVSFPLAALIFVIALEYIPKILEQRKIIFKKIGTAEYIETLAALIVIVLLLIVFTPLGKPVKSYITLSEHFTTASIPLFATVQEYAPTGFNYNFGNGGFGLIGQSVGGIAIIVWGVLAAFVVISLFAIYYRSSKSNMLYIATIIPLAVAGMIEVKYLPHFGVGYILALAIIIGELLLLIQHDYDPSGKKKTEQGKHKTALYVITGFAIFLVLIELVPSLASLASAAANNNCTTLANSNNILGYNLYCNTIPQYWLTATAWMSANIGPNAPRVLAWWDYGDWINWFGNSNAVIRGDNAVAQTDYNTAAQFVLSKSDGITSQTLITFMESAQAKYVLFDDQIQQKWQALDFLACIDVNQTTLSYAQQQGQAQNPPQPYALGTSNCEVTHDPVFALIPLSTSNINNYCSINGASSNFTAIKAIFIYGQQVVNNTYCVPTSIYTTTSPVQLYNQNGTKLNAIIVPNSQFYYGTLSISGSPYADFLVLYLPNGPNNTITDAPTLFYNSNYYQGFMFGKLPGFTRVYPSNFTGINYVNSTNPIVIFSINNYTGGNPYVVPKPSWINNNYTMPG